MSLMTISSGKITDSASIVPVSVVNDVTASRSITGSYTNTTKKTMYVIISTLHQAMANTGTTASFRRFVTDFTYEKTKTGFNGLQNQINCQFFFTTVYIVPPGETQGGDSQIQDGLITLLRWIEIY